MGLREAVIEMLEEAQSIIAEKDDIDGLQIEFFPWHGYIALSLRAPRDEIRDNPADWKMHEIVKRESGIDAEIQEYQKNYDQTVYEKQLNVISMALRDSIPHMGLDSVLDIFVCNSDDPKKLNIYDY